MFVEFVQNVWDPLSSKETTKLVNLIKGLHEVYPSINGKSKQLQVFYVFITFFFSVTIIALYCNIFLLFIDLFESCQLSDHEVFR